MTKKKALPLSIGQRKLHKLGMTLPTLPLTSAGSLPKHTELTELRYKVSKGVSSVLDLERRERLSTEGWLREQTNLGFDVLVDGEMNRGDMVTHFTRKIDGFENGGTVRIFGNRYYQRAIIKRKLMYREPLIVPSWQLTQRATQRPVKAVITGAYTLMDSVFNEFYSSRIEACQDLTSIIRREVVNLVGAGAKIIQIDEMALCSRPDELPMVIQSIKEITNNLSAYFILRHGYTDISECWPKIERFPVDQFYFEAKNSDYKILNALKKFPTNKDITIGFIDSHSHLIETPAEIEKSIKVALKVLKPEQLWIGTDSGLKTRRPDQATAKLSALAKATQKLRLLF